MLDGDEEVGALDVGDVVGIDGAIVGWNSFGKLLGHNPVQLKLSVVGCRITANCSQATSPSHMMEQSPVPHSSFPAESLHAYFP